MSAVFDSADRLLTFELGGMLYALPISGVLEVAEALELACVPTLPPSLGEFSLELAGNGDEIIYTYDTRGERTGIRSLLNALGEAGLSFRDLQTTQSSLEDIFVDLVKEKMP